MTQAAQIGGKNTSRRSMREAKPIVQDLHLDILNQSSKPRDNLCVRASEICAWGGFAAWRKTGVLFGFTKKKLRGRLFEGGGKFLFSPFFPPYCNSTV